MQTGAECHESGSEPPCRSAHPPPPTLAAEGGPGLAGGPLRPPRARAPEHRRGRPAGRHTLATPPHGRSAMTQTSPAAAAAGPLSEHDLALIDAYWRAANYLSVGQIYLLDNPLLREPLRPEHVKPRLLGHWGTTPGLNFIYAHLNRVIRNWDLDAIYVMRPGPRRAGGGRQRLPRGHLQRGLPAHHPGRGGPAQPLPPVLVPRRHPEPRRARDARLDPRGRRARLRARARLRRGLRQPRPARRLRRRRRRGRDRPAGDQLALEQVPRPGDRRRRAADPAPQRLQDRQPHGAGPHPATTS